MLTQPASAGRRLFFASRGEELFAGTHFRALGALGLPLTEDSDALAEQLAYGSVAPPRTVLAGVRRCAPESTITARPQGDGSWRLVEHRRWPVPGGNDGEDPTRALIGALRKALVLAGSPRIVLLSGGLDSTVLAAIMRRQDATLRSYSAGYWFDGVSDVERGYAESAARDLGAIHEHHVPGPGRFLAAVVRAIETSGEPLPYTQCALLDAVLARLSLPFACVVVNGQGADAAFAPVPTEARGDGPLEALFARLVAIHDPSHAYASALLGTTRERIMANRWQLLEDLAASASDGYELARAYLFLVEMDGAQATWTSSAERFGVRMFYPFVDKSVLAVAGAVRLAVAAREPKHVLRQAGRLLGLPEAIISRRKRGFGPSSRAWAAHMAPLARVALDGSSASALELLRATSGGRYVLWNLINQQVWRRVVLSGESGEALIEALDPGSIRGPSRMTPRSNARHT